MDANVCLDSGNTDNHDDFKKATSMILSALPSFEGRIDTKYSISAGLMMYFTGRTVKPDDINDFKRRLSVEISKFVYLEANSLFSTIFKDFSSERSKDLAKKNVRRLADSNNVDEADKLNSRVYGEVELFSLCNLLERADIQKGDTLYDLGHGTGKAMVIFVHDHLQTATFFFAGLEVITFINAITMTLMIFFSYFMTQMKVAAALLFGDILHCIRGIELLGDLCNISITAIKSYNDLINSIEYSDLFESRKGCSLIATEGDFLTPSAIAEWTRSDIVFANSTCFDAELMQLIATHAVGMKRGSRLITFTTQLPSNAFEVREKINFGMSWGIATCYIHIRY
jgi:Histone methylation protein DOT1